MLDLLFLVKISNQEKEKSDISFAVDVITDYLSSAIHNNHEDVESGIRVVQELATEIS